jgi:Dehydrogenases with different specificities (related to short-chain alcohol dehydrogenases)
MPTVLITGVDKAPGQAFAEGFRAAGWRVLGTGADPVHAGALLPYDPAQENAAAELVAQLGDIALDAVIFADDSTAGNALRPEEIGPNVLIDVMMVNTYAPLDLAARLIPNLKVANHPAVVAISGNAGMTGTSVAPLSLPLKASKAALRQMWRNLAVEWADWGCRCLVIASEDEARVDALIAALAAPSSALCLEI